MYAIPEITAIGVARTWKLSGTRFRFLSVLRIAPLSASSVYHAVVRITNETKNGTSSIRRKKFLRFARNAIQ